MRISDCGLRNVKGAFEQLERASTLTLKFRIPQSAFRNWFA